MLFTGDTLLGAILIAAALGFWLGEYYGKRTARPRVVWRTAPPPSIAVDIAASKRRN